MNKIWGCLLLMGCNAVYASLPASDYFSAWFHNSYGVLQVGNFWSTQGRAQHINILGLIGDDFTLTKSQDNNALIGLGYFFRNPNQYPVQISYGVNAFYLSKVAVAGHVIQEKLFDNLSYQYRVTNLPVYAGIQFHIPTKFRHFSVTTDVGVGPNFMSTSGFAENSLDGITLPDQALISKTNTTWSATLGVNAQWDNVFHNISVACGYRFFDLGEGNFNTNTNQIVNNLSTGHIYANAILCSASG